MTTPPPSLGHWPAMSHDPTRFVWFWNFWHWSRESFRVQTLLRDPLHGLGGNWLAWYAREATSDDLAAIDAIGRDETAQRALLRWIIRRWSREADPGGNRLLPRFIVTQLAAVAPFVEWPAFRKHGGAYGCAGVSAIVLAQGSDGEADDVREIEALALPDFSLGRGPRVVCEGFQADESELNAAKEASVGLLCGRGLGGCFVIWALVGDRPFPRWVKRTRALGWLGVVGLIALLRFGPDPGERLKPIALILVALYLGLAATGTVSCIAEGLRLRREGKALGAALQASRIRLRMRGDLILKGGSAGLAFCLNILLAVRRAYPNRHGRSHIWRALFHGLRQDAAGWAATGVITPQGGVTTVVLEPKLRACLQTPALRNILTPRQGEARREIVENISVLLQRFKPAATGGIDLSPRFGYAAGYSPLRLHRCQHLVGAVRSLSGLTSRFHACFTLVAVGCTLALGIAGQDLRYLFTPPPAPEVLPLPSPTPQSLWLGLDTRHPQYFGVVLESDDWINRRVNVESHPGPGVSTRAEIPLVRVSHVSEVPRRDSSIWIEQRAHFLGREFQHTERLSHFPLSSLSPLPR